MKKVKVFLAIMFLAAFSVVNVSSLFTSVEAKKETEYMAGFKIYDAEGKVIGCDCPAMRGSCICVVRQHN